MQAEDTWVRIDKTEIRAGDVILIGDIGTARTDGAEDIEQTADQLRSRIYYKLVG